MKNLLIITILFLLALEVQSQNVGVGTSSPTTILDVVSTSQGVLIPRLTTVEMNAIASPAGGLMVTNTDSANRIFIYTGLAWKGLSFTDEHADTSLLVHKAGTETIGGIKIFTNDILVNGVTIGKGAGNNFANTAIGNEALFFNTSGGGNTALGFGAGKLTGVPGNLTTASNSIFIGYNSKANGDAENNQIVIGQDATGDGSNTTVIGNASIVSTKLIGKLKLPVYGIGTNTGTATYSLSVNATGDVIESALASGGTVTNVTASAPLSVTGVSTVTPNIVADTSKSAGNLATYSDLLTKLDISAALPFNLTSLRNNDFLFYDSINSRFVNLRLKFLAPLVWDYATGTASLDTTTALTGAATKAFVLANAAPVYSGTGLLSLAGTTPAYNTTSAGIAAVISDEVGTDKLVFNTTPVFVTNITTPVVLGGSATTSSVYVRSTTATPAAGSDIRFQSGSTDAMTINYNGLVGIGTTNPTTILDVTSTTKGVLIPRLTKIQMNAIASPASGLMITNTDSANRIFIYTGLAWKGLSFTDEHPDTNLLVHKAGTETITGSKIFTKDLLVNGITAGLGGGSIASNVAIGNRSLFANTTGISNTAVGKDALVANTTGIENTAIGFQALFLNISGIWNTATGKESLRSNTTGRSNTAIGNYALNKNTTASYNTASGYAALFNTTTGTENTATGNEALYSNTTGELNTAFGADALNNSTTGGGNTALGYRAGRYISTLDKLITTDSSIFIGYRAKPLGNSQKNQLVIGFDATGDGSNTTVLGNAAVTSSKIFGQLKLPSYGTGANAGTPAFNLATDAAGNIIEAPLVSGTVTGITASNNTGQTWTITNPSTAPNLSLVLTSAAVGLSNVDNTADVNKPVSTATQTALDTKVNTNRITPVTLTDGATITWDIITTASINSEVTLTGTGRTLSITNPVPGEVYVVKIIQDGTGNRTITTWPANTKWIGGTAPTLTTTSNSYDIVSFYYDGTNFNANAGLNYN